MKINFLGHSGFMLEGSKTILVDPFLTGNPLARANPKDLKADYILITHGHGDHLGDALEIAKRNNATIISVFELANYCTRKGLKAHPLHIGGGYNFDGIYIKATMAWHGNSLEREDGAAEYLGVACGFIIYMDGKTIYHSGDTGLFLDMELIGILNPLDLAILPIGDNFTMGSRDALEAVKLLKAPLVIPMHYNTFPLVKQDPILFKKNVEKTTTSKVLVLNPGESIKL